MSNPKSDKIIYSIKSGFTLCQQNGQRSYGGPPPNWGSRPPPSRDCEVFIGRLPRMCFEDELIPLFLTAGELYEFRLMLDFSGTNRGYGYAHYATPAGAQRAIQKLNKYEIRPGHQIGVLKSKNNCRLLFGNIKAATDAPTFNEFIRTATDHVLNVFMFKNFEELKQTDFRISSEVEEAFLNRVPRSSGSKQFAIVEFENHKAAAVARRVLIPKYGHILAIDWAVPPREKKRHAALQGAEGSTQGVDKLLLNPIIRDPKYSKLRPVPTLLVEPSYFDDVPFMPKNLKTVVKFFKYQLSVCLYKSVQQLEISLYICNEIEKKIVDHVTNVENCGQAVQLILNYISWYNEKKRCVVISEAQKMMQEVKMYADSFVIFINKKLKLGASSNSSEDEYYTQVLPLQLNILFRIILHADAKDQVQLSGGITKGLKWLTEVMLKENKASRPIIQEVINYIRNEDGSTLDKATDLAKIFLFRNITSNHQNKVTEESRKTSQKQEMQAATDAEKKEEIKDEQLCNEKSFPVTVKVEENFSTPLAGCEKSNESLTNTYPGVPLLFVQPSITSKVPFMPDIFGNVLVYFKHLIRACLSVSAWQMSIPEHILCEVELKIIDRISNMENCSDGVQLILNYLSWWVEKRPCNANFEVRKLLQEVKVYADSFADFIWAKTMKVYVPNEAVENYFCKVLPLRLNLLFQMMVIFNTEGPMRFLIGISKGLKWLDDLVERGNKSAKEFLEELTRYSFERDPEAYDRAKHLGKAYCAEMMTSSGQVINQHPAAYIKNAAAYIINADQVSDSSGTGTPNGLSLSGSDNASVSTLDYDY